MDYCNDNVKVFLEQPHAEYHEHGLAHIWMKLWVWLIMHYLIWETSRGNIRNIIMDAIKMNQGYACECSITDEEPNVDITRFFYLLKDFDKPL